MKPVLAMIVEVADGNANVAVGAAACAAGANASATNATVTIAAPPPSFLRPCMVPPSRSPSHDAQPDHADPARARTVHMHALILKSDVFSTVASACPIQAF